MYDIIFYTFAAICLISGGTVVFARKIVHAAFALLFTLFGVAGLYIMLGADFVGITQLLIYVGGILVLFLFGMMLTANIDRRGENIGTGRSLAGVVAATAVGAVLLTIIWGVPQWRKVAPREPQEVESSTSLLGQLFMGDYALLFIASSIAILVALVGAAMIARSDRLPAEDAAKRM